MDPNSLKPNLLSTVFAGVQIDVNLDAYGIHALERAVATKDPDFERHHGLDMWVVELVFRPEFAEDKVTGQKRAPIEITHLAHKGLADALAQAFTASLVAAQQDREKRASA